MCVGVSPSEILPKDKLISNDSIPVYYLLLPFLELHFPISIIHTLSLAFLSLCSYSKRSQKHQPNKSLILSQLLCSSIDPQASQCPGFLCSRYHMVHGSTLGTSWRFCTVGPWGKQRDGDYSRIQGRENISNGRSTFCLSLQSSTKWGVPRPSERIDVQTDIHAKGTTNEEIPILHPRIQGTLGAGRIWEAL